MKALNFYSSVYHAFLLLSNKRCTIRLGDKREKYPEGEIILVLFGERFKTRKKVFKAVVDRIIVKPIRDLTVEECQMEDHRFNSQDDVVHLLERIYERPIARDEVVSLIQFSEIEE